MKKAIFNFIIVSSVTLLTTLIAFMTPLASIEKEITPPTKTERHLHLENKEFLKPDEMDLLRQEISQFEERWDKKAESETITVMEGLEVLQGRTQYLLAFSLTITIVLISFASFREFFLIVAALCLFTFALPILLTGTTFYLVVVASVAGYFKLLKTS
ncbi:MAG: hypothetical protein VX841_00965 [Pseudomonadota bacterium]|nr:hypothetical protein [Pseudomonadota bacterium]